MKAAGLDPSILDESNVGENQELEKDEVPQFSKSNSNFTMARLNLAKMRALTMRMRRTRMKTSQMRRRRRSATLEVASTTMMCPRPQAVGSKSQEVLRRTEMLKVNIPKPTKSSFRCLRKFLWVQFSVFSAEQRFFCPLTKSFVHLSPFHTSVHPHDVGTFIVISCNCLFIIKQASGILWNFQKNCFFMSRKKH